MNKEERFQEIEAHVTSSVLMSDRCLGKLHNFDLERMKTVLHQRRHMAYLFTPMCEYFIASLNSKEASRIVRDIALEEFDGVSHRRDYIDELHRLGDEPSLSLATWPTIRTALTMIRVWWTVLRIARGNDLERLVFLRYMGEVSTGQEFAEYFFQLEQLGALTSGDSRFLHPHVRYDLQTYGDHEAHAERYLKLIVDRIETEDDWKVVREVIVTAAKLRERFYAQF
jgi:hypothetical protein